MFCENLNSTIELDGVEMNHMLVKVKTLDLILRNFKENLLVYIPLS